MAQTSAHTRTYASVKAMANLEIHNTREWTEDHPAPGYLLAEEHWDPRGNVEIRHDLTPEMVIQEYLETNPFGQKHGKLHHKAKPLRETVVVCEARHGREDMEKLMTEFDRRLPFRCMYGYLHRDEGHIDKETGIVKHNWHMHIGHTNLIDGQLVNPGKAGLRKLQDICAEVLGMERGTPVEEQEEKRPHLPPKEYRRMARERDRSLAAERTQAKAAEETTRELTEQLATRNREYDGLMDTNRVLSAENVRLREDLVRSNATREADAQALERLKNDPNLNLKPGLDTVEDLATHLVETNRKLWEDLKASDRATQENYKTLAAIKKSDLSLSDKLVKMAEHVDRVTGNTRFPKEVRNGLEAMAQVLDSHTALKTDLADVKNERDVLVTTNRELRETLKTSQNARQGDYVELARIKNSAVPLEKKLYQMVQHVVKVTGETALNDVASEAVNRWAESDRAHAALEQKSQPYLDAIRGLSAERIDLINAPLEKAGAKLRQMQPSAPAAAAKTQLPSSGRRGGVAMRRDPAGSGSRARVKSWDELEEEERAARGYYRSPGD